MDGTLTAANLEGMLTDALAEYAEDFGKEEQKRNYLRHRDIAHAAMVRAKRMPAAEADDVRFYEMRSCGFDPAHEPIRNWFFTMSDDDRRELVMISHRMRIRLRQILRVRRGRTLKAIQRLENLNPGSALCLN